MEERTIDLPAEDVAAIKAVAEKPAPSPQPQVPQEPLPKGGIHFWDVRELPSNGLAYPEGAKLSYRTYTFGEMEAINRSTMPDYELVTIMLQGMWLKDGTTDITSRLAEMDANFMFIQRKLKTLGVQDKFSITPKCPVCGKQLSKEYGLHDVVFDELKDKAPAMPMVLPLLDGPMKLTLPTILDWADLMRRNVPAEKEREFYLARMAERAGDTRPLNYLMELIRGAKDPDDQAMLQQAYDITNVEAHDFVIECVGTTEEPHDKFEVRVRPAEVRAELVTPFRQPEAAPRRKIQFGA